MTVNTSTPRVYLDVGPGLTGGYRVARVRGALCDGQLLFDTARDVAAAARLCGLAVLTTDTDVLAACAALGVACPPPRCPGKNIYLSEETQ